MQTRIQANIMPRSQAQQADAILRRCVHCGFCNATCPTYQLLGDERDGPRGRIYLIKQVLEGRAVTRRTQQHLDRCLTCRACETTCPSGVEYGHLLELGREVVEQRVHRPIGQSIMRAALRFVLHKPSRLAPWVSLAQVLRGVLPARLKHLLPVTKPDEGWPTTSHPRRVILPGGCVQAVLASEIDGSTARVLDKLGISALKSGACCGALSLHLGASQQARTLARSNIDAWWPLIENGAEAVISTASGCGVMIKDYAHLLQHDPDYAEKARHISSLTRDLVELLEQEPLPLAPAAAHLPSISFHPPCTLQHGQKLAGRVEALLVRSGFSLQPIQDAHLCCGSAGTYSITQPHLSRQLRANRLAALTAANPSLIVTANVGCLLHLASESPVAVKHWIQLFDPAAVS